MTTKFFDHIQGSSTMVQWVCDECGHKWCAASILPCDQCEDDPEDEFCLDDLDNGDWIHDSDMGAR